MSDTLQEMFEFAGKASATIVKDLAEICEPLTEAFRRGWRQGMAEQPKPGSAPSASNQAPGSAEA